MSEIALMPVRVSLPSHRVAVRRGPDGQPRHFRQIDTGSETGRETSMRRISGWFAPIMLVEVAEGVGDLMCYLRVAHR